MKFHSGAFIQRYGWFILALWLALAIVALPFLPSADKVFKIGGITDPNVESSKVESLMQDKLPYGGTRLFVFYESDTQKATNEKFKHEVEKSLDGLKGFALSYHIISPYQNSRQISSDKHSAYAIITFDRPSEEIANWVQQVRQKLGAPGSLTMYMGGEPSFISDVKQLSRSDLLRADLVAFPISIVALVLVFGTLIAGLLPVFCGVLCAILIIAILYIVGQYFELSIFVLNIASMMGLGLSLDYTLLIVSRFREEIAQGHTYQDAISIMLQTSGKAVFFSAMAVIISLSALFFFSVNILNSIGFGGVISVIISLLTALFFLPSLLFVLGKKVNSFRVPFFSNKAVPTDSTKTFLYRLAMMIMRRPLWVFFPTILFLLFLGYPVLQIKINRPDSQILPTWVESRELFDHFTNKFNANELTPIFVVAKSNNNSILTSKNISALYDFVQDLKKDARIDDIGSIVSGKPTLKKTQYEHMYRLPSSKLNPSVKNYLDETTKDDYTLITVVSKYADNDPNTFDLVDKIRNTHLDNQITVQVGGYSATIIDTIHSVYKRFFYIIAIVSVVTYLVLLILLRSLFLPLKAIIMNFLSLCVSYGMLVFIFQEGHFSQLLNFKMQGFTDINLPILLFCGLFGLSMDYEVFLLTRIKEFYERTQDNNYSVAMGLERSGRVITSAALIVVLVAASFVTADILFVKAFGLAMALAVAIDATVIRLLLVPATMCLLGKWNWYLPKWLDKILPEMSFAEYGHSSPVLKRECRLD